MRKIRKEVQEVEVEDYYAEVGDVIKIPGKRGEFVVEEARMTGGGSAQAGDVYPDAWQVKARKLTGSVYQLTKVKYNPKATLIEFTQHTNCYNTVIDGVEQIGKMEKIVDFRLIMDD